MYRGVKIATTTTTVHTSRVVSTVSVFIVAAVRRELCSAQCVLERTIFKPSGRGLLSVLIPRYVPCEERQCCSCLTLPLGAEVRLEHVQPTPSMTVCVEVLLSVLSIVAGVPLHPARHDMSPRLL